MVAIILYCIDSFGKEYRGVCVCPKRLLKECIEEALQNTDVLRYEVVSAYVRKEK